MIAQIVVFSRKTDAQRKKNFAFRSAKIAQKFCEWKPYALFMRNSNLSIAQKFLINFLNLISLQPGEGKEFRSIIIKP